MIYPFKNLDSTGIDKIRITDVVAILETDTGLMFFKITKAYPAAVSITMREFLRTGDFIIIQSTDLSITDEIFEGDTPQSIEDYNSIMAVWGIGGDGGIGRQFNWFNTNYPLGPGPGAGGGSFAGAGGDGGDWGEDGDVGVMGTSNGTVGLNYGRTSGGLSIMGWNTYAKNYGSTLGNEIGGVS